MTLRPAYLTPDDDGVLYVTPKPSRRLRLRRLPKAAGRALAGGTGEIIAAAGEGLVKLCAFAGGVGLGLYALVYCLALGPLGWFAGLFVVPVAFYGGAALGFVAGYAILCALVVGLPLWFAVTLFHAL